MYSHQRQEQVSGAISGRKINNYLTCTVKEVKRLSPQLYEEHGREQTFETDSFKQILSKRSGCPNNKENMSQNKALRKIKEQKGNDEKKKSKSNLKRTNKGSAVSLTKLFERNRSPNDRRKKQTKSVSPSRDMKDYRSGPVDKKNYLSNHQSKNRQVMPSRSEKSLTDRVRNPLKTMLVMPKKDEKKVKLDKSEKTEKTDKKENKGKKGKNIGKTGPKKMSNNMEKTQSIAKQFDSLLFKQTKPKQKKTKKSKEKPKKSKQKKIVVSHNNSKNCVSKNKLISYFSDDSPESGENGILSTRYQMDKPVKRERLSLEPTKKKGKSKEKAKTEALSPEKSLANKNEAATVIQKMFRGYLTRKYIKEFKRILVSVITIQRMWRGYKCRKDLRLKQKSRMQKKEELRLSKMSGISQVERLITPRQNQLASLLEQILNEKNVNEEIKNKISNFLKKEDKPSASKNNSAASSHMEQQMKSEKRFFQKLENKEKYRMGSPIIHYSPNLSKSEIRKSPEVVIINLLAIKEFQREKLITNAKMQLEGLENLSIRNIFSPRTRDSKKNEIHKKLEEDLQRFDESMSEVIKSCQQSQDIVGSIKPFSGNSGHSTPEKSFNIDKKRYENSPTMKEDKTLGNSELEIMNSSQRKVQDLSMELLEYYEQKTNEKVDNKHYDKLDCSYKFIEEYLLSLFEFLKQLGEEYRQSFVEVMGTSRNLEIGCFLKNLNVLTEDSDDDISFKLPMYKYLEQQEHEVLSRKMAEQFNNSNKRLQRHHLGIKSNLEDTYLKMIIDAVNEALNLERPKEYIFTESSLVKRANKLKYLGLQGMQGLENDDIETQFSLYFANSMNHIYKWAHFQCGRVDDSLDEISMIEVNEVSLKHYLKFQALKMDNYYDELLEVIVALSNTIFDQIISEQGVLFYNQHNS